MLFCVTAAIHANPSQTVSFQNKQLQLLFVSFYVAAEQCQYHKDLKGLIPDRAAGDRAARICQDRSD